MSHSPTVTRERELKFDVPDTFVVPELGAVIAGGTITRRTVALSSTYYDTTGLNLLAQRVTLRRRTGDTDTGWQLKIPAGAARAEIGAPLGEGDAIPEALLRLVAGLVRADELVAVATLRTERHLTMVRRGDQTVVEIADDHVVAGTGESQALVWREVEVELGPAGDEGDLASFADALRAAGARPSPSASKLARALGRDEVSSGSARENPLAAYVRKYHRALVAGDIALRRDQTEVVHRTRVATRRLRSVLRVFADVLQLAPETAAALDAELSWYQDLLGEVRDRQVLRARFADLVATTPDELVLGPVAARIDRVLLAEQVEALAQLTTSLTGNRYRRLLASVAKLTNGPVVDAGTSRRDLRRLADRAARKAAKRLRTAERDEDPEELHRARRAAKRARYAAEVVGRSARTIKRYKRLQDVLGEHQDAIVAAEVLRRIGASTATQSDENGFTFGLLYQRELDRAATLREQARALRVPS